MPKAAFKGLLLEHWLLHGVQCIISDTHSRLKKRQTTDGTKYDVTFILLLRVFDINILCLPRLQ